MFKMQGKDVKSYLKVVKRCSIHIQDIIKTFKNKGRRKPTFNFSMDFMLRRGRVRSDERGQGIFQKENREKLTAVNGTR
jgi:hypothetical protein